MTAFSFAELGETDLPLVHRWYQSEPVLRWYARRRHTLDDVRARYLPNIRGEVPTVAYLAHFDGRPGGFIKTYALADYPEYAAALEAEAGWAGIDFFIGEDSLRHRGLGAPMIRAFVEQIVFIRSEVTACVAGPDPDNRASWRALKLAGFEFRRDVTMSDGTRERLMHRARRCTPA
jgi:RimJ/RimL family protein N-acetyltransferase